jgi:hypothetical protein
MPSLLLGIVMLRLFSGSMEILAAFLIYRLNSLETALKINSILASIGPLIFLGAMYLGLTGLTQKMPYGKVVLIYLGAGLIFWGLRL